MNANVDKNKILIIIISNVKYNRLICSVFVTLCIVIGVATWDDGTGSSLSACCCHFDYVQCNENIKIAKSKMNNARKFVCAQVLTSFLVYVHTRIV